MSRQTQRASCSSGPRRGPDRRRTLRHACPHRLAVASTNRSRQSGPRRPQPGRVVRIGAGCTLQCNMPAKWLGRCRADQAPLVYLFPLPYADLGACDTVIPAVPPAIAGRAMWGPASAGWEPPPRAFPLPLPPSSFSQTHYFQGTPQFADENGFARMAGKDEIREKGGNLSIPLYVRANNGKGSDAVTIQSIFFSVSKKVLDTVLGQILKNQFRFAPASYRHQEPR